MMKYVLITGASSGIGKALAEKFAKQNHNLIIVARRDKLLNDLKKELEIKYKIRVLVYVYDLSIYENVIKFYDQIKNFDIEVFINNAGFGDRNDPWDSDLYKIKKMIDLNITALTIFSILFIKDNLNKDVQLINVSSTAGYKIWLGGIIYSASKFYVSVFGEGIAKLILEKKAKLKMKILAPSSTKTEFVTRSVVKSKVDQKILKESEAKRSFYQKSPQLLAEYAYKLYQSDKIIGIVDSFKDKFYLEDNYFEIM
ncbi:MAG: oxidoreductase [Candidatus Hepatoplasma scabrum]|nr:MAG: oxidoreductase [Candidatus Hepatoplasma sp.]